VIDVKRRAWRLAAGVGLLLVLGVIVPRYIIGDGLEGITDTDALASATAAYELAQQTCLDSPLARIVVTGLRVTEVVRDEGSCEMFRGTAGPQEHYRVTLTAYSAFGVPVRELRATCGGKHIVC
jgi:hypothetical protein